MAEQRRSKTRGDALAQLPAWARQLAERYYTKTVSTFLVHGAVRDLQPALEGDERRFVPLKRFLARELFGSRDLVLFYDRAGGITFAEPDMQRDFARAVAGYDAMHGTHFAQATPKDPARALALLESFVRVRVGDRKSVAVILDFAETLAPATDFASMGAEDRLTLVTLDKWAHDPLFLEKDVSFVLVAENVADLHPRLARNPHTASIAIPLPDEAERADFIEHRLGGEALEAISDVPLAGLAKSTAGLSRVHLDRLLSEATERDRRITPALLKARKKEIIEAECRGLLEFLEPKWGLDSVAGHGGAKELLRGAAGALRAGKNDVLPMGYLIAGPVGTGKTFLAMCFAADVGIPCVKLLNFRSQWQGATEGNLEKIFNLLKAMWPVAVIIDEADAFLGDRSSGGDSGTSNRVFAAIASFMGNTEYRGKILWFLLTCRPDLLPIDLKRQGRAEEHLALFYPQTDAERDELFRKMAAKSGVETSVPSYSALLPADGRNVSGADIEAVLVRARFRAVSAGREAITDEDLRHVIADFVPPSYPLEVELQVLAAVVECTSRELVPEAFRSTPRDELLRRLQELKLLLADR